MHILASRLRGLERELQDAGFDSADELFRMYKLQGSDETTLGIRADPVAMFMPGCSLNGSRVRLVFRLSHGLQTQRFRLVIRSVGAGMLVE